MTLGIFGASGLGREILETVKAINEQEERFGQVIFVDDNPELDYVQGVKVYSLQVAYENFGAAIELVLAVGEPSTRRKIIKRVEETGLAFTTIIHPSVKIPESTVVGNGSYIAPHSFISCNVKIGNYALIQPNVNIGHDCELGENVSICGMATLGGHCILEDDVFVAMGASVIQNCLIGRGAVIGLGSVVYKDLPQNVTAIGNPARVMGKNEEGHRVFK